MTGRRSPRTTTIITIITLGAVLAGGVGCASDPTVGWATTSTFRTDINTVAVPIVQNETYVRGVEFDLTDALIKEIGARTPYSIQSEARADTVLLVHIRQADLTQLSKSRNTGLSEEVLVGVTIDFEWRDQRRDTTLVERRAYTGSGLFLPSAPDGERIELGRFAAVQQLARDVVSEMRAGW